MAGEALQPGHRDDVAFRGNSMLSVNCQPSGGQNNYPLPAVLLLLAEL